MVYLGGPDECSTVVFGGFHGFHECPMTFFLWFFCG